MNKIWCVAFFSMVLMGICLSASAQGGQSTPADLGVAQSKAVAVSIPDASLEAALRKALNKPTGSILDTDLAGLVELLAINSAKNGRLSGYSQAGANVLQVTGFGTLTNNVPVRIVGDNTSYTLVAHTSSTITINPGLTGPIPSATQIIIGANAGGGIVDLTGLEYCTKLKELDLTGNSVVNLAPLAGLTKLIHVYLTDNQVTDVTPLNGSASTLAGLSLANNKMTSLASLSGLTNLLRLDLWKNQVVDLSPLATLKKVFWLDLRENLITDTTTLAGLTNLTGLALDNNAIGNAGLAKLSTLTSLTRLAVNFTQISSLAAVQPLTNLHILAAGGNTVTNFAPLVSNAGLAAGDYVFLGTAVGTANDCGSITTLRGRGVIVDDLDACQPAPDRDDGEDDYDHDGLNDYEEVMHYCDPAEVDTDGDGTSDGWEVLYGLNPLDARDADWDLDGDGLENHGEFERESDPTNNNDPYPQSQPVDCPPLVYIFVNSLFGVDDLSHGWTPNMPCRSIQFAIIIVMNYQCLGVKATDPGFEIVVSPGVYEEPETLNVPAGTAIRGSGTTGSQETKIVGNIAATYPAKLDNFVMAPRSATPPVGGLTSLITVVQSLVAPVAGVVESIISNIILDGNFGGVASTWSGTDIQASAHTEQTVMNNVLFRALYNAVTVQGSVPAIVGCIFRQLTGDVLQLESTATATTGGGLGSATDPNSGYNTIEIGTIQGDIVQNDSTVPVTVENNDFGGATTTEITDRLGGTGVVTPPPAVVLPPGTAQNLASATVTVWDSRYASTEARITNASVTLDNVATPVTDNVEGVYQFYALTAGTHTFTVKVAGYLDTRKTVTLAAGDRGLFLVPMVPILPEEGEAPPLQQMAQYLYDNFDAVDTDNDDQISLSEAQLAQPFLTAADFAAIDANGDGQLSLDELEIYLGLPGCHCAGGGGGGVGALVAGIIAALGAAFFLFFCFSGC